MALKTIYAEIKDLSLPDEIKEVANRIFQEIHVCTRQDKRRLIIFACLFFAHKQLNQVIDPQHLAELVGIKRSSPSRALKICREFVSGYRPPTGEFTVYQFLEYHLHRLGVVTGREAVLNFARQILPRDASLEDAKPQHLSVAIINVFFQLNNRDDLIRSMRSLVDGCPTLIFNQLRRHIYSLYVERAEP